MESSFGNRLKVTISGGSHEPSVNVSITGLPENFRPDMDALQRFMDRRAPGKSRLASPRKEADIPVLKYDSAAGDDADCQHGESASSQGDKRFIKQRLHSQRLMKFEIANTDHRSADYDKFRYIPRPGHADYTARLRYGENFNMAGGGPFSGRMTAPLCVAGGLALQVLAGRGISVSARLISAGSDSLSSGFEDNRTCHNGADSCSCCNNQDNIHAIEAAIAAARDRGDSVGGIVECIAEGVPAGIGGAMYDGLESILSPILFGIPAVKGVEFGAGFEAAHMTGSENNDAFFCGDANLPPLKTRTNNCGGILGGITTGMPLVCRVAFKPTPSISIPQESVDLRTGQTVKLSVNGRHDPCVALRAVPVVEAAVALGLLDAIMITEADDGPSENSSALQASSSDITSLRQDIDAIDSQILGLFESRMKLAGKIGRIKENSNLPVKNESREEEILKRIRSESFADFAPYADKLFRELFSLSRDFQQGGNSSNQNDSGSSEIKIEPSPSQYGLIGHPLGHSFSCQVHEAFKAYSYELFDLDEEEMTDFVSARNFRGLSVTRPYKQAVIPLCDRLTDRAKAIGAVNTLYWEGETLVGHNTDYDGFLYTATRSGIDFADKCVLILGTGGTSRTVSYTVTDRGARCVYFASRNPDLSAENLDTSCVFAYGDLSQIADQVDIIVNTTPAGMYPDNLKKLISLRDFPSCQGVIDVIYNPSMTLLLIEAESLGLKWANGMPMIVAQAAAAAERFTGHKKYCSGGDASENASFNETGFFMNQIEPVLENLTSSSQNIVLIGMPGCGKSTIGRLLSKATGRTFVDLDNEIERMDGRSIPEIFASAGEKYFRETETSLAGTYGSGHGQIIATGGGIVLNDKNFIALKQNGIILWLTRPIDELPLEGRPLSENRNALHKLYDERSPLYEKWADFTIDSSALLQLL